jgi:hypothetical protein
VFTARYALSPYIKQIRFVFKGLGDSVNGIVCNMDCTLAAMYTSLGCNDIKKYHTEHKLVYVVTE